MPAWRFWTQRQQRSAEEWIGDALRELDLACLKPSVITLLGRFCDHQIPDEEKQPCLVAAIIIVSKFEVDEAWIDPSDMLPFYAGPLSLRDYKNQLICLEREILHCVHWRLN